MKEALHRIMAIDNGQTVAGFNKAERRRSVFV
jgi:hypothetical protein